MIHARRELVLAGMLGVPEGDLFDEYNEMAGQAVLELVEKFAAQGHSGFSASMVLGMFTQVADFKPLSPLTNDPEDWIEVNNGMWQCRRQSTLFSDDGGKTYYNIDEYRRGWKRKIFGLKGKIYTSKEMDR